MFFLCFDHFALKNFSIIGLFQFQFRVFDSQDSQEIL